MRKYATISVPVEVKKILEKAKGEREWGEFLLSLYREAERLKGNKAFEELAKMLTKMDLENIMESSREFRERLALR